jgi:hypothetical protein
LIVLDHGRVIADGPKQQVLISLANLESLPDHMFTRVIQRSARFIQVDCAGSWQGDCRWAEAAGTDFSGELSATGSAGGTIMTRTPARPPVKSPSSSCLIYLLKPVLNRRL